jgi:hypothetical protein
MAKCSRGCCSAQGFCGGARGMLDTEFCSAKAGRANKDEAGGGRYMGVHFGAFDGR